MYKISKTFTAEYAHRLLLTYRSPCESIHGHHLKVMVEITSSKLDENGMIMDFKELDFVKEFIDVNIDHTLILNSKDPLCDVLQNYNQKLLILKEMNPTAENLSKYIYVYTIKQLPNKSYYKFKLKITCYETKKCFASYSN